MEEKIAIVIPAYKCRFLRQTLDSIVVQTCRSFTVYIGDDASPQNLKEIVSDYADKMNIVYRRFDTNLGGVDLPGHWDRCIALAKEPVVWFFSDDDLMPQDGVERIIKALECYGTRHGMFRFPLAVIDENGKIIHKNPSLQEYPVSGGFVKFPLAWCSDDATWTSIGENAGGMIPLPGKPVCWRNVMGENISCSFNYDEEKIVATRQFIKWVSVFYSDRLQDRKLQHAIKKYAHTILHYSLQDRYKLHDLMGICRSLWYICPSVSLSVAFRMCKLKLRNRKR